MGRGGFDALTGAVDAQAGEPGDHESSRQLSGLSSCAVVQHSGLVFRGGE